MVRYLPTIICLIAAALIYGFLVRPMELLKPEPGDIERLQKFTEQNPERAKDCGIEHAIQAETLRNVAFSNLKETASSLSVVFLCFGVTLFPYTKSKKLMSKAIHNNLLLSARFTREMPGCAAHPKAKRYASGEL